MLDAAVGRAESAGSWSVQQNAVLPRRSPAVTLHYASTPPPLQGLGGGGEEMPWPSNLHRRVGAEGLITKSR